MVSDLPSSVTLPTIFVSVASYRDPDCQSTVCNLFEQAAHPERIFVGVCLQVVAEEDKDCLLDPPRSEQVRIMQVDAAESRGACWARHRVQQLFRGEDYFFQIDSHMRFVAGWDEKCITMLAKCPSHKPVLSTYPLMFTPPDQLADAAIATMHVIGFDEAGIVGYGSSLSSLENAPPLPTPSASIAAGQLFASGEIVEQVPYDPHLYFAGEEISLAVRLFTSGWDIFTPNDALAFHDYTAHPHRPRHWENQPDWYKLNDLSRRRLRHLFDVTLSNNPDDLIDINEFGLGKERSIHDYETFSGLDFKGRMFRGQPFPQSVCGPDQDGPAAQRRAAFASIWASNGWGCVETRSGPGSTVDSTRQLRIMLKVALEFFDIKVLADAGCGDLNWLAELLPALRFYFGYDLVPDVVSDLRNRFSTQPNCFFNEVDVVVATLAQADAILCRDCLTHLPLESALMALQRFRMSGARYLFATTHSTGRNVWITDGAWYGIDLTAAPFNLPSPTLLLPDGNSGSKRLGVWMVSDLPL